MIVEPQFSATSPIGINDILDFLSEDFEIMQSTGLKDKNGKEIFEGDIVQIDAEKLWYSREPKNRKCVQEVNFEEYDVQPFGGSSSDWHSDSEKWEIIGNIYQNPELLP